MKQIRKTISLLLTVIMVFSMFTIIPAVTADTASGISYIDEHGEEQTADNVTVINSATTTLDDGWYAVN